MCIRIHVYIYMTYTRKGKLKVLQSHYQRLESCSVDDANWKQEVDSKVNNEELGRHI